MQTKCPDHGTRDASGDFTCRNCGATWDYADGSEHPATLLEFSDSQRLDFLIEKRAYIGWCRDGEYCGVFTADGHDERGDCLSGWAGLFTAPRAAIDRAMRLKGLKP